MTEGLVAKKRFFHEESSANWRILGFSIAVLLFALLSETDLSRVSWLGLQLPSLCAFRLITGLDCPGCGLTRAVILAAQGNFWQSYLMHIWGIPLMLLLLFQIPYRMLLIISDRATFFKSRPRVRRWVSHFVILSLLLPWAARTIITVAPAIRGWI